MGKVPNGERHSPTSRRSQSLDKKKKFRRKETLIPEKNREAATVSGLRVLLRPPVTQM